MVYWVSFRVFLVMFWFVNVGISVVRLSMNLVNVVVVLRIVIWLWYSYGYIFFLVKVIMRIFDMCLGRIEDVEVDCDCFVVVVVCWEIVRVLSVGFVIVVVRVVDGWGVWLFFLVFCLVI